MVELIREFIKSCKTEAIISTTVSNNLVTSATDIPKQDLTNFLQVIPYVADSLNMIVLTRISNDLTWKTN
jgi:hypothetical protein